MITNVLEYLEASCEAYPHKPAAEDDKKSYAYSELVKTAKSVASAVSSAADSCSPVAVMMKRGADNLPAFMGAVYAGRAYSYINTDQPTVRTAQILEVLSPSVIITDEEAASVLSSLDKDYKTVSFAEAALCASDEALLKKTRDAFTDTSALYINFTSGSTGVPKGVAVSHRSVIDFIENFVSVFDINENDVIANQAPFDFDVSVKDIYSAFKTGAKIVIIPKVMFSMIKDLMDYLCEKQATVLIWAVSAMCIVSTLKGFMYRVPETVSKVLFSGEQMPVKQLNRWQKNLPNARYVNLYGPTEITCNCTYYEIKTCPYDGEAVPIGKPFPNESVFLLSDENALVTQPNQKGEICVGGTCLALGYWNAPELTERAFVQNPLNASFYERIYKTGDMAYYNEKHELCFAGRKDFQIKFMGHRIELEEIQRAVNALGGAEQCVCIFNERKNRITAFYTGEAEPLDLKEKLHEILPPYMVPARFMRLLAFPLTQNGKTDRKKLICLEENSNATD